MRVLHAHGVPVVPRGAGTGLSGGATPVLGGVTIGTARMRDVLELDPLARTARVQAGVVNVELTRAAAPHGLFYAPDPSSQAACTIGGNVANNSGGPHCLSEGSTTSHVLGMEVVLAGGEIVVLGGEAPDPIGLDLKGLIVGSEGTLGIVTKALVRLLPIDPDVRTLLMDFPDVESAAKTVSDVIAAGLVPAALELMDRRMCEVVENWLKAGLPTESAAVLLAEVVGETEGVISEAEVISGIARSNGAYGVQVADTESERALLWLGRKSAFGAIAQLAPDYYLHDAVVPRTRLVETMSAIYEIADRYDITMLNVFHAGDGNLHPLIAFDSSDEELNKRVHRAGDEIVALCLSVGGALSGEHGIGIEKRDMMRLNFTDLDLDAQARLKEVLDPAGVFNPTKILPEGSRCFDYGGVRREMPDGVWV
jgi:glycolate oxidase